MVPHGDRPAALAPAVTTHHTSPTTAAASSSSPPHLRRCGRTSDGGAAARGRWVGIQTVDVVKSYLALDQVATARWRGGHVRVLCH